VTTVLQYLVIAAVIGLVAFALAVFLFGRGEQLAPLSPRTSPTELPERGITGAEIGTVKFAMALRGYRMSDVDWALERLGGEIDRLRAEIATLSGGAGPPQGDAGPDTRTDAEQPVFADAGRSDDPSTQTSGDS
jgi:DivIVA domain-containing protein